MIAGFFAGLMLGWLAGDNADRLWWRVMAFCMLVLAALCDLDRVIK